MNQLPSEIVLIIGELLPVQDCYALSNTCSRMRELLERTAWSHVQVTDTSSPKTEAIGVTATFANLKHLQQDPRVRHVRQLTMETRTTNIKKLPVELFKFCNPTHLHITAEIDRDEDIDKLHKLVTKYPSAKQSLDLSINYDWCAPDSALITASTQSLVLSTNKYNDLKCVASNLANDQPMPKSLTKVVFNNRRQTMTDNYFSPPVQETPAVKQRLTGVC